MAKRREKDSERFRWWLDDRDGLQFGFQPLTSQPNAYSRQSGRPVNDLGLKVAPSNYDTPPPSKKSLGGEGDISGDPRANSDFNTASNVYVIPPESTKNIVYVNSSSSVRWNTDPVVYVVGSNANQIMAVNPQLIAGTQSQQIALECVGSSITLKNGSGLTLDIGGSQIKMSSGSIACLMYQTGDLTWHMTSFNQNGGF